MARFLASKPRALYISETWMIYRTLATSWEDCMSLNIIYRRQIVRGLRPQLPCSMARQGTVIGMMSSRSRHNYFVDDVADKVPYKPVLY